MDVGIVMTPEPFPLHVPDAAIADLKERLGRTRLPDQTPGPAWAYGTDVAWLQAAVTHWRERFDWSRSNAAAESAQP